MQIITFVIINSKNSTWIGSRLGPMPSLIVNILIVECIGVQSFLYLIHRYGIAFTCVLTAPRVMDVVKFLIMA